MSAMLRMLPSSFAIDILGSIFLGSWSIPVVADVDQILNQRLAHLGCQDCRGELCVRVQKELAIARELAP